MTEFTTWRSLVDGEEISDIPDPETLQSPEHTDTFDADGWRGVAIDTADEDFSLNEIEVQIYNRDGQDNISEIRVYNNSTETVEEEDDGLSIGQNDSYTFSDLDLNMGDVYLIQVRDGGSSYNYAAYRDGAELPVSGTNFDIIGAGTDDEVLGGTDDPTDQVYVIGKVTLFFD